MPQMGSPSTGNHGRTASRRTCLGERLGDRHLPAGNAPWHIDGCDVRRDHAHHHLRHRPGALGTGVRRVERDRDRHRAAAIRGGHCGAGVANGWQPEWTARGTDGPSAGSDPGSRHRTTMATPAEGGTSFPCPRRDSIWSSIAPRSNSFDFAPAGAGRDAPRKIGDIATTVQSEDTGQHASARLIPNCSSLLTTKTEVPR
jgi:hypothetical protein